MENKISFVGNSVDIALAARWKYILRICNIDNEREKNRCTIRNDRLTAKFNEYQMGIAHKN